MAKNNKNVNKNINAQLKDFKENANSDTDIIVKPNCKLCQSEYRKEAEELYNNGKTTLYIAKWLKEKGEKISQPAVWNHLQYHFMRQIRAAELKEYAEDVKGWVESRQDRDSELQIQEAVLRRRLYRLELIMENDRTNVDELIRSSKIEIELVKAIHEIEEKREALTEQMKPVEIVIDTLREIISVQIKQSSSTETVDTLKKVIHELQKAISEMDLMI